MLKNKVQVIGKVDPLKHLMSQPIQHGWISQWMILLLEFHLEFQEYKTIKSRVVLNFLAYHPIS